MTSRSRFARELAKLELSHVDRAVAFLYFYSQTQEFEERSASELAADLSEVGFPKPKASRLREDLRKSQFTVRGTRKDTYRIDIRRQNELDKSYSGFLNKPPAPQSDTIIPTTTVAGTRTYLDKLVLQINACYDAGFYDACAVMCRRLMESLILEAYITKGRHSDIQYNGVFVGLDKLIGIICSDRTMALNRNTPKIMADIKQLGDTAAHDRVYITQQRDIDDIKIRYRRMIDELLHIAGLRN